MAGTCAVINTVKKRQSPESLLPQMFFKGVRFITLRGRRGGD